MAERNRYARWSIDAGRRNGWGLIRKHVGSRRRPVVGPGLWRNEHGWIRRNAIDAASWRFAFSVSAGRLILSATDVPSRSPTADFFRRCTRARCKRFVRAVCDFAVEWIRIVLGSFWLHLGCLREPCSFSFSSFSDWRRRRRRTQPVPSVPHSPKYERHPGWAVHRRVQQ